MPAPSRGTPRHFRLSHSRVFKSRARRQLAGTIADCIVNSRYVSLTWVYTSNGVKRFVALCRALSRLSNARESVSGVPVYTSHAGISARQRAPESAARRRMLQSSTVLNFRASRQQFSQSCTGVKN